MSYTVDCLKTNMPAAMELLCDCVLNPAFLPAEVDEQKQRLRDLLQNKDLQVTHNFKPLTLNPSLGRHSMDPTPGIPSPSTTHPMCATVAVSDGM